VFCLLVIAMLERTDFFQKEARECKKLAAQAPKKNDREYWLGLAQRWESLLQPASDETDQTLRFDRPTGGTFTKRFVKGRAA
jgi:hypothetical protein